ncbi:TIGR00725 family protein [Halobacteria archaeon AArc-m2/3/4]|uniref:TIGR00725 family protein n=1 Tax=Natronoglomus mannanivorans TaxID=2979990 RepID=A0AAP2Z1H1_9EURY|nr:TIGR00725 family protein [Halobacteria archaeon AArc-xg1-1]MCU4972242.1 TIGR00725 family protein [Halobacteria archaeon AArc-m2/3/4]
MRVSIIGGGTITDAETAVAVAVGRELGERGHTVVCGGLGGTMEAVCRGAKAAGGETIGILPLEDREAANEYVDTAIATGMGHARNALVPLNGDAVIALSGGPGTLSEIGFALVYGRPVVGIDTHDVPDLDLEIELVETPKAAVDALERAVDGSDCDHERES